METTTKTLKLMGIERKLLRFQKVEHPDPDRRVQLVKILIPDTSPFGANRVLGYGSSRPNSIRDFLRIEELKQQANHTEEEIWGIYG